MRSYVTPGIRPYARCHMPPVAALPLRAPRRICKLTPHRHTCSCAQNENRKFWIAPSAAAVCVDRDHVWIASRWSPSPLCCRCSSPRTGSTRAHLQQRRAKVMSVMEIEPVKDVILVTAVWAAMYYLFMQMGPAP